MATEPSRTLQCITVKEKKALSKLKHVVGLHDSQREIPMQDAEERTRPVYKITRNYILVNVRKQCQTVPEQIWLGIRAPRSGSNCLEGGVAGGVAVPATTHPQQSNLDLGTRILDPKPFRSCNLTLYKCVDCSPMPRIFT